MNKKEREHRFALTLLFSFVVLGLTILTTVIAGLAVYLLMSIGIISVEAEALPHAFKVLLLITIVCNIVGFVVTLAVSRFPLSPINTLINKMNCLASGDFKARMQFGWPITKHSSFMELSDSFNKMATELENTEVLRSDFINNFSHEFKTPIVSIAGFTKLLKRGNLTDKQKREYLDVIEEESMRLSQMATNVLNLTKVENQTILTEVSSFNLSEQIRSCLLLLETKWSKKHIELEVEFGEYMITANEELLKQVWINLIDNAIKFSNDYGTLHIDIAERDDIINIAITNTGIAIPVEKQSKIFNKFYQADESHATEGNGTGLAIVSRVVDLHGGIVSVESKNSHTTFTVQLPKSR